MNTNNDYCLFEDHYFNSVTKSWQKFEIGKSLRKCLHSRCTRLHKIPGRSTEICPYDIDCPNAGITCFKLHDTPKLKPLCRYGENCIDIKCIYRHPHNRNVEICKMNEKCEDAMITCFKLHNLSGIVQACRDGDKCINYTCLKRHPVTRMPLCDLGPCCYNYIKYGLQRCNKIHPRVFQKLCKWDTEFSKCKAFQCPYVHDPENPPDCPDGMSCPNRSTCIKKHPKI